jgi:hypothetical protein
MQATVVLLSPMPCGHFIYLSIFRLCSPSIGSFPSMSAHAKHHHAKVCAHSHLPSAFFPSSSQHLPIFQLNSLIRPANRLCRWP